METEKTSEKLITKAEIAAKYGVSVETVDSWVDRGLPYIPIGAGVQRKQIRFRWESVQRWLEEQERGSDG